MRFIIWIRATDLLEFMDYLRVKAGFHLLLASAEVSGAHALLRVWRYLLIAIAALPSCTKEEHATGTKSCSCLTLMVALGCET